MRIIKLLAINGAVIFGLIAAIELASWGILAAYHS
jgi:hypothetical protein